MEYEDGTLDPSWQTTMATENDSLFLPYIKNRNLEDFVDNATISKKAISKARKNKTNSQSKIRKCSQCPYKTSHSGDFIRHLKRHASARFTCSECNMPFMAQGHLNGHKRSVHQLELPVGDKISKCEICGYTTRHSSDIRKHRIRHKSAPISCNFCNRPFFFSYMLDRHLKRVHGNDLDSPKRCDEANIVDIQNRIRNNVNINKMVKCTAKSSNEEDDSVSRGKYYEPAAKLNETHIVDSQKRIRSNKVISKIDKYVDRNDDEVEESLVSDAETDIVLSDKVKKLNQKVVNLRRERSEAKRRKENAKKANRISQKYNDGSKKAFKYSKKTKSAGKQSKPRLPDDNNNAEKNYRERIACAFCKMRVKSYKELQEHLEVHDIDESDICDNDIEHVGKGSNSNGNVETERYGSSGTNRLSDISDFDECTMMNENRCTKYNNSSEIMVFHQRNDIPNIADDLALSETDSDEEADDTESDDDNQDSLTSNGKNVQNENFDETDMENDIKHTNMESDAEGRDDESEMENLDIDAEEFVDAVALWNGFIAKLKSRSKGVFRNQPFACAKCVFTTSNLDYLKIHTEAHLYDIKTPRYSKTVNTSL